MTPFPSHGLRVDMRAGVEALKSLYKQKGPAVVAVVEKASATADAAVVKAANAAIEGTEFDPTIARSLAAAAAAASGDPPADGES